VAEKRAEPPPEPPPEPDAVAVDVARLDGLRRLIGDAEFHKLADKFLGDLSRRIALMERLAGAGDHATLAREAHSLRGTAGSYGLESVAALAGRLETACAAAARADIAALLAALDAGMAASVARLTAQYGLATAPGRFTNACRG
jgi:HPt (histidine-containing phosphotransfer) domain-containing protein